MGILHRYEDKQGCDKRPSKVARTVWEERGEGERGEGERGEGERGREGGGERGGREGGGCKHVALTSPGDVVSGSGSYVPDRIRFMRPGRVVALNACF